ncbi:hypothetical protein M595_1931 [Lyngbya aestuarii BL J]|uniref:Uncharacterized protein n=1 Tax=Lyngbya aestuarii BL J TaxID=1348334 RepID=U7QLD2_9CYAN|nr:hypothetical protein M595_1931 [Lyngbya aestuarii BL J]
MINIKRLIDLKQPHKVLVFFKKARDILFYVIDQSRSLQNCQFP